MKVSELIDRLSEIQKEYGDLPVRKWSGSVLGYTDVTNANPHDQYGNDPTGHPAIEITIH